MFKAADNVGGKPDLPGLGVFLSASEINAGKGWPVPEPEKSYLVGEPTRKYSWLFSLLHNYATTGEKSR